MHELGAVNSFHLKLFGSSNLFSAANPTQSHSKSTKLAVVISRKSPQDLKKKINVNTFHHHFYFKTIEI